MAIDIGTNLLAFIIVLGFLIFAHEAGHFLFAKLFGVRVLVFSFGFGQRLFGFRKGDTDYRVSLIPLGGYVRMAGDDPEENRQGQPDEYLSQPKWQRFLILLAGPGANVLIAIVFLAALFVVGIQVPRIEPVLGTVLPDRPAARAGLQPGDRIVSANGEPITGWEDLKLAIGINPDSPVRIEFIRNGERMSTVVTPERVMTSYGSTGMAGVMPFIEPVVGDVIPGTAAAQAGLQPGDRIISANGREVRQLSDLDPALQAAKKDPLHLVVERDGRSVELTLPPIQSEKQIYPGFTPPTTVRKFGIAGAFRESVNQNWRMVRYIFYVIGRLFRAEGSVKDFTGPISIARISGEMLRTGWKELLWLMAAISLNLGIMNLLPIPVLDGGHILILGIEGLARHDLSIRAKERIQKLGFAVLAALMIVVLYQDVIHNVMFLRRG